MKKTKKSLLLEDLTVVSFITEFPNEIMARLNTGMPKKGESGNNSCGNGACCTTEKSSRVICPPDPQSPPIQIPTIDPYGCVGPTVYLCYSDYCKP